MAEHALKEIQLLYRIEHDCDQKQLTENERMGKRQELAGPIMDALKLWMETEGIKYSPNSLTGKAITYAYARWENMMRYLQDGRIHINNNLAENAIRPITLGRKNYLFCGDHQAAISMSDRWLLTLKGDTAIFYSVLYRMFTNIITLLLFFIKHNIDYSHLCSVIIKTT